MVDDADDCLVLRHRHSDVFHAIYGEHEAFVSIASGEIVRGALPKAAARLVEDWALAREQQRWRIGGEPSLPSLSEGLRVSMLTKIVSFERNGRYRLSVRFNDGSFGIHDFAEMVAGTGTLLVPLRDPDYFARVFLECGALTWPNGFDIAPEWLRREMAKAKELARAA